MEKKSFWLLSFGGASAAMMTYGLLFWLPSFLVRSFGDVLPEFFAWLPDALRPVDANPVLYVSYFYGFILLVGGLAGIWLGGVFADRFGERHKSAYALVPAVAFIATIPFFLVGVLADSLMTVFLAFLVIQALSFVFFGPILAAFQQIVGPNIRATSSAVFLFINNLIGIGLGNLAIGALSDFLTERYGDESLRYSIASGTIFYVLVAIFFILAARHLEDDW